MTMSLLLVFISLSSSIWLSRLITKEAVLLAPAVTLLSWSLFLGIFVGNATPVSALWWPFWFLTFASAAISVFVYLRQWRSMTAVIFPALCAFIVLAPYLYYGIRFYPGSWFWDGFAYLATAETLWRFPITTRAEGLEPLYLLGQSNFAFRFIGASLIAVFRGVLPIGAGSDGSVGFFLVVCIVTYACSCAYVARRYLETGLQAPFILIATVSGPLINLVWANNFDHLLALSIAPAIVGFALEFDFKLIRHAVFLGVASAVMMFIYPEMSVFLLLPAALVLLSKVIRERPTLLAPMLIAMFSFALTMTPLAIFIQKFMVYQLGTVGRSAGLRPGNGYFPTLLNFSCFYGALSGLYAPFQPCTSVAADFAKFHLGMLVVAGTIAGMFIRRDALSFTVLILSSAVLYFLLKQHYDYAAFKILSSSSHIFFLLAISSFNINRASVRWLGVSTAAALVSLAAVKIFRLDEIVRYKSLAPFSEVGKNTPINAIVAIKVSDPLKFEWATYYLRNHTSVPIEGAFVYLKPEAFGRAPFLERKSSYTHVITDTEVMNGQLVWENSIYRIYQVAR
jgi:hypothetical protein